jgi:hypothetical protein
VAHEALGRAALGAGQAAVAVLIEALEQPRAQRRRQAALALGLAHALAALGALTHALPTHAIGRAAPELVRLIGARREVGIDRCAGRRHRGGAGLRDRGAGEEGGEGEDEERGASGHASWTRKHRRG